MEKQGFMGVHKVSLRQTGVVEGRRMTDDRWLFYNLCQSEVKKICGLKGESEK